MDKKNAGSFFFVGAVLILFACSWTAPSEPSTEIQRPQTETLTATQTSKVKPAENSTPTATIDPNSQALEEIEFLPEATPPSPTATPTEIPINLLEPISFNEEISDGSSSDEVFYSELLYLAQAHIITPLLCDIEKPLPHLSPANEFLSGDEIKVQYETDILSCWKQDETVLVTISGPDNSIYSQEKFETADYNQFGLLTFPFKTDVLKNPAGVYLITFEGSEGKVQTKLVVVPTNEPELYWQEDGSIFFNNFQPNEAVKLFVYTPFLEIDGAKLHAHASFKANRNGQLIINPAFKVPIVWIGVIGAQSGLVEPKFETSSYPEMVALRNSISWPTSETGVEACHLLGETGLQASAAGGDIVTITADIALFDGFGKPIASLKKGDRVEVVRGVIWQEIRDRTGEFGWHWSVIAPNTNQRGSIWEGYFSECA